MLSARRIDLPGRKLVPPFLGGVWVHSETRGDGDPTIRLFWLPEFDPGVVSVHAEPVPPSDPEAFDIADYANMTDLVMDAAGAELLVLDDGVHQIELEVKSGTLSQGPVRLKCEIDLFAGSDAKAQTVLRLNAFRRYGRFPNTLFPPERRAPKWAQALQAYDGMVAGASLREIACALYSEQFVNEEWNGRSAFLKARIQRMLKYGRKMVNGDYKALLQ
ncbi:MAG: DUF2285 domain-containing protein [Asticcacaulis sp.]|uniref:DNA -binding domain-containing protein n=1 Tax=Asticcacaulis sp. TaxID=1872648 RepID=UPI0039E2AEF4